MCKRIMGPLLAVCGITAVLFVLALSQCRRKEAEKKADVADQDRRIGNCGNMKLHLPTCRVLPDPKNRVAFASREEALAAGYSPCSLCKS